MNQANNKCLHTLLNQSGLTHRKSDLVMSFTSGRSESSKDMTDEEAREMIRYLQAEVRKVVIDDPLKQKEKESANKMRRAIISMAWQMNWTKEKKGRVVCDVDRINEWCMNSSYLKKEFNSYIYRELPKLVSQFKIVLNSYLNSLYKR